MSFRIEGVGSYVELVEIMRRKGGDEQVLVVNTSVTTVRQFIEAVKSAVLGVFDFDGTLTDGNQFSLIREHLMIAEFALQDYDDVAVYFGGDMQSNYGHISFIGRTVDRIMRSVVKRSDFVSLTERSKPRDGALELIDSFFTGYLDQPLAIISYGLCDWIRAWTLRYIPRYSLSVNIHALNLVWDSQEMLSGCELGSVVSDGNKGYKFAIHCAKSGVDPSRALVVGDSPSTDLSMLIEGIGVLLIPDSSKTLSVKDTKMFADHRIGAPLQKSFEAGVQAFLLSDSLDPLVQIRSGKITA